MFLFTDICLEQIARDVAARKPEVGGALFKIPESNVICEFMLDSGAQTSGSSYLPSAALTELVRNRERDTGLHFAGILHSHPGTMSSPSGQDHRAFALTLATNPRLGAFVAPIVTIQNTFGELKENQCRVNSHGLMTLHVAYRAPRGSDAANQANQGNNGWAGPLNNLLQESKMSSWRGASLLAARRGYDDDPRNDEVDIFQPPIQILWIDADIIGLCEQICKSTPPDCSKSYSYINMNGTLSISVTLTFFDCELILLIMGSYPVTRPVALLTPIARNKRRDTVELQFEWPVSATQIERLQCLISAVADKRASWSSAASNRASYFGRRTPKSGGKSDFEIGEGNL